MQQKLCFLFFPSLCLLADLSIETTSSEKCYFINQQSKETWKLVWQDNFQSEGYFKENWVIDHGSCYTWNNPKICNVKENVKLQDGFLVMSAKEEKYDQMNFTSAMLITKREFDYGRFEARTALSVDRDVWSFFSTKKDDWKKDGHFIMHQFDNVLKGSTVAVFPNNDRTTKFNKFDIDYSSFHLYGMEWSEKEVKFFVDDHYSEPILLNATRMIKPEQQIRLFLGVRDDNGQLLDKYNWKCPLWIVDYVRVYEKVSNPNVGLKLELCEEQNDVDQSGKKQRELVNSICANKISPTTQITTQTSLVTQKAAQTSPTTQSTTKTVPTAQSSATSIVHQHNTSNLNSTFDNFSSFQWKSLWSNFNSIVYVTFGIVTLLFITFIVRLRYRINKMKQPKVNSPNLDEIELDERHQYEPINYDVREANDDKHEYLPIYDVEVRELEKPSTISQCLSLGSDDE